MTPSAPRHLPLLAQIIRDETWLEAERRGQTVPPDDPVVRANVCAVVLRMCAEMHARLLPPPATFFTPVNKPSFRRAA